MDQIIGKRENCFSAYPTPEINYCLKNIDLESRNLLRRSKYRVIEDFCLQRCGDCYEGPFLVVNGEAIAGRSHRELLDSLERR